MRNGGLALRTIVVLRAVGSAPDGIGLSQIARNVELPKATCLRILTVLVDENLVVLDPGTKLYRVALGMLSLMSGVVDVSNVYGAVQRELTNLATATRETVGIDIVDAEGVMVVFQAQGPQLISQTAHAVPRLLPDWCTSTGKVLQAWQPQTLVCERSRGRLTQSQIDKFLQELEETRTRGFGLAFDELEIGAAAVAVPIRRDGDVVAALWIGGPTFRMTPDSILGFVDLLFELAERIEELLMTTGGWLFRRAEEVSERGGGDVHENDEL